MRYFWSGMSSGMSPLNTDRKSLYTVHITKVTSWSRELLEKLIVRHLVKFPTFLEAEALCRAHTSPPTVPILSQMHPVHTFSSCFLQIKSKIILPSTPGSSERSLPYRFSNQNTGHNAYLPCMLHGPPISSPWFGHTNSPVHNIPLLILR